MENIKIGDRVDVFYCDGSKLENARVVYIPNHTGDLWQFKKDELIYAQNPCSSNFDTIVKKEVGNAR